MKKTIICFLIGMCFGTLAFSKPNPKLETIIVNGKPVKNCGCDIACPCTSTKYPGQDCCSPQECKCGTPHNPSQKYGICKGCK